MIMNIYYKFWIKIYTFILYYQVIIIYWNIAHMFSYLNIATFIKEVGQLLKFQFYKWINRFRCLKTSFWLLMIIVSLKYQNLGRNSVWILVQYTFFLLLIA